MRPRHSQILNTAVDLTGGIFGGCQEYRDHSFQLDADGTVTGGTVKIQYRISPTPGPWVDLQAPLEIPPGPSTLNVHGFPMYEVRAVLAGYAGTGNVRVAYFGA